MDYRGLMIAAAACIGLTACGDSPAATEDPSHLDLSKYHLTYNETFRDFDVSAWGPGTRWIAHTPWNGDFGDAIFADPDPGFPFETAAGILRIEARRGVDGKWRSGLIASQGKRSGSGSAVSYAPGGFAQTYGYFEIETKLPPGPGTWPAFWLSTIGTAPGAEIDVFEYYGHAPDGYHANVHTWFDGQQVAGDGHVVPIPVGEATHDFNRYGVDIDRDWVTFYYNRRQVWRAPTRPEYRQPMYMLVDLALGSGWPINRTPDPSFMYVKSIKVFARLAPS